MSIPKIKFKNKKPNYVEFSHDLDFFKLFQKLEKNFKNCFILESLGEEGNESRYHVIGFDPEIIISARGRELTIRNTRLKKEDKYRVQNPYRTLSKIVPQDIIARQYAGGLIGYISYEAMNYFESAIDLEPHPHHDQFKFGVYKDGLVYDKVTGEIFYFYYDENRIDLIQKISQQKIKKDNLCVKFIRNTKTRAEHKKMVADIREEICAGNIFQCVAGFKSEFNIKGDKFLIYEKLREVNPSPYMYYLKFDSEVIIGASPELLFGLRQGEMSVYPLAGTIRRGKTEEEDRLLARELLNSKKDLAEHAMLVDLHRNDIGRVARFGTVKVRDLMNIKKFSHVQHISSEVTGFIKKDKNMFDGLASNFPMGTVSGAPKI